MKLQALIFGRMMDVVSVVEYNGSTVLVNIKGQMLAVCPTDQVFIVKES